MNIHQISGSERVLPQPERAMAARATNPPPPQVDLSGSEALNRALQEVPDARRDRVESLRTATASIHYPPEELIRGISRLIAEHWVGSEN